MGWPLLCVVAHLLTDSSPPTASQVRSDPWSARRYFDEAQKIEEAATEDGQQGGEDGVMQVNDKTDAVAVITTGGVIKVVNKCLVKMFGYRRAEDLVGKNVRRPLRAPHPLAQRLACTAAARKGECGTVVKRRQRSCSAPIAVSDPTLCPLSTTGKLLDAAAMCVLATPHQRLRARAQLRTGISHSWTHPSVPSSPAAH